MVGFSFTSTSEIRTQEAKVFLPSVIVTSTDISPNCSKSNTAPRFDRRNCPVAESMTNNPPGLAGTVVSTVLHSSLGYPNCALANCVSKHKD